MRPYRGPVVAVLVMFSSNFLLGELTVVENIALGLAYAGVDRATRQTAATELAEQMGLGHRLQHRPLELSGGQMACAGYCVPWRRVHIWC